MWPNNILIIASLEINKVSLPVFPSKALSLSNAKMPTATSTAHPFPHVISLGAVSLHRKSRHGCTRLSRQRRDWTRVGCQKRRTCLRRPENMSPSMGKGVIWFSTPRGIKPYRLSVPRMVWGRGRMEFYFWSSIFERCVSFLFLSVISLLYPVLIVFKLAFFYLILLIFLRLWIYSPFLIVSHVLG